ncbi:hypothetical protein IV203_038454 [Nitzschia inconspicua]|uniref:Uncharacterized protein n=1 Tax=Nitzschia inconspicua TaxID=303405 RepID=A0A9K3LRG3_9STRA|nr:hypothetical protein IV203_038454 [Nitzschia inconspicua]
MSMVEVHLITLSFLAFKIFWCASKVSVLNCADGLTFNALDIKVDTLSSAALRPGCTSIQWFTAKLNQWDAQSTSGKSQRLEIALLVLQLSPIMQTSFSLSPL